jgi:hypothetical protein
LCYVKAELVCFQRQPRFRKNQIAMQFIEKTIGLIDTQIDFARWQMQGEQVRKQSQSDNPTKTCTKLKWQGSLMELVELIYSMHEAGCFGDTPLKTAFEVFGKTFGCEITNYYRLFWDIRNRMAEDRAYFLNKLLKALSDKLIRMDSGKRS